MPDSPNEFASLQKLWDTLCSVRAARGIDEAKIWREWTRQKRESLKEFAAVGSFDELCRSGCHAFPLAITLAIFQPLQSVESKWQLITDPPRRREQQIRILEKSAAAIGGITGNTLWCQHDVGLKPFAVGIYWMSNILHTYCLHFRKRKHRQTRLPIVNRHPFS